MNSYNIHFGAANGEGEKKVSETKESERVGRSRNRITTRSQKESLKKIEYNAKRFVDSKDHKRRSQSVDRGTS